MEQFIIEYISPLFYTLLQMSLAALCIGLGVLVVRKLADKGISPFWKNALWLLVLVALILPYRPTRTTAVLPSVEVSFSQQKNEKMDEMERYLLQSKNLTQSELAEIEGLSEELSPLRIQTQIFEVILPTLWLLGMAVMGVILLVGRRKMMGHLGCGQDSSSYTELLADCKKQLNITQPVRIYTQNYLNSPALWGLIHPKILLPDYATELSQDSQRYILLHELSHLKHWDLWKNALLLTLQVVYWFNPLVWVLFRFIRQDMELLNDQRVLEVLEQSEETPYARSLVEVLGHTNRLPFAPQMLCMVDDKGNTKRRIQMIKLGKTFKKHRMVIAISCLVVIGVLSALFLTAKPADTGLELGAVSDELDAPLLGQLDIWTETDVQSNADQIPIWPLPEEYSELSSPFGERTHPVTE